MNPSASRLDLLEHCRRPARSDVNPQRVPSTAHESSGISIHCAIEDDLPPGRAAEVGADPKAIALWRACDLSEHSWRAEIPLLWDALTWTAHELPKGWHDDPPVETHGELFAPVPEGAKEGAKPKPLPHMIPIVPDLFRVDDDGTLHVVDIKTGKQDELPHASESKQLLFYALALRDLHDFERVVVYICHLPPDSDRAWVTSHEATHGELDELAARIEDLVVNRDDPFLSKAQPGRHCYAPFGCPALLSCKEGVASVLAAGMFDVQGIDEMRVDDETFAALYQWCRKASKGTDALERLLKHHVRTRGAQVVSEGREYAAIVRHKQTFKLTPETPETVAAKAIALVKEAGAFDAVVETFGMAKGKASDAIRLAKGVTKKEANARASAMFDKLEEIGAVVGEDETRVEERKVKQ